jgi:hypothetical protein
MHFHPAKGLGEELALADSAGAAIGLRRALSEDVPAGRSNRLYVATYSVKNGKWSHQDPVFNSRVNQGASWLAGIMGSSSGAASANYIGLTTDTGTPALTDIVLPAEIATNGLSRAAASYGSYTAPTTLNGTASYVLSKTFTYTGGTSTVVAKAGLYYASSGSTLAFEALLSSTATVSASGDQIAITWTITI